MTASRRLASDFQSFAGYQFVQADAASRHGLTQVLDFVPHTFSELELESARDLIWSEPDQQSAEFAEALDTLRTAVEGGEVDYAGVVAETFAFPGPLHDAALAYKFYYLSHALEGYRVTWSNQSEEESHYLGSDGDFRNEAVVSDLVHELGVHALPALDVEASIILATEN